MQSVDELEEYKTIVREGLDKIEAEEEANSQQLGSLKSIPQELLMMQGASRASSISRESSTSGSPTHKVGGKRGRATNNRRGVVALPKPLSEKGRKIRKALMAVQPDKKQRRVSQKRASMVVHREDESAEDFLSELFGDGSELKELEREKKAQIRKIVESMRQHLVSAHQSKTRGGKVIYGHLYGEMKQKSRDAGMVFSETDTSMSPFLAQKFEEDARRRKEKRELEEEVRVCESDARCEREGRVGARSNAKSERRGREGARSERRGGVRGAKRLSASIPRSLAPF